MDAGDATCDGQSIVVVELSKPTATGRVGPHEGNLVVEIEFIEAHGGSPMRKRERACLSAASAYGERLLTMRLIWVSRPINSRSVPLILKYLDPMD
jgi:hypothetical protein